MEIPTGEGLGQEDWWLHQGLPNCIGRGLSKMMVNYMSDVAKEMSWKSDKIRRDFAQHRLSAYSPDFTADEAVWDWAREEVTANECLGTKAKVQEKMYVFFGGLAHRKDEVKHR